MGRGFCTWLRLIWGLVIIAEYYANDVTLLATPMFYAQSDDLGRKEGRELLSTSTPYVKSQRISHPVPKTKPVP